MTTVAWADRADLTSPCNQCETEPATADAALAAASETLNGLLGYRFTGVAEDVVRPCGRCWSFDRSCSCYPDDCSCPAVSQVRLPMWPVVTIEQVLIDGLVVDPARYRIDDDRWLVFVPDLPFEPGERQGWPGCQDFRLPVSEVDTWQITYTWGQAPPSGGAEMAAILACEFMKAWDEHTAGSCRLPRNSTAVSAEGITVALSDPQQIVQAGLTGLPEVDLWVQGVWSGIRKQPALFMRPGARREFRRSTGPSGS